MAGLAHGPAVAGEGKRRLVDSGFRRSHSRERSGSETHAGDPSAQRKDAKAGQDATVQREHRESTEDEVPALQAQGRKEGSSGV